jgi:hypothetical protein
LSARNADARGERKHQQDRMQARFMTARKLLFHDSARHRIQDGVDARARAVKVTLEDGSGLALLNAGSIAGLILTIDCRIANAPAPGLASWPCAMGTMRGAAPEF